MHFHKIETFSTFLSERYGAAEFRFFTFWIAWFFVSMLSLSNWFYWKIQESCKIRGYGIFQVRCIFNKETPNIVSSNKAVRSKQVTVTYHGFVNVRQWYQAVIYNAVMSRTLNDFFSCMMMCFDIFSRFCVWSMSAILFQRSSRRWIFR